MKAIYIFIVAIVATLLFVYHNEQSTPDAKYKTLLAFASIVVFELIVWALNCII